MPTSKIITASITDDAVTTAKTSGIPTLFRPNIQPLVINGDMAVAQRGTSTTSNGALIDRWKVWDSTDGVITYTTSTESPEEEGFTNSLKVACSTADTSIAADQYAQINYFIEGQDCQTMKYGTSSAETITLAFWIRSKQTGTFCTNVIKAAGSGTRYEIVNEFTVSVADTWEKKIITMSPTAGSTSFITSAAGAIADSNANGYAFSISLAVGTDYHTTNNTWVAASDKMSTSNQTNFMSSTSNEIYITGVQLEVGEYSATNIPPFQHESYGNNLSRCQRYYQKIAEGNGKRWDLVSSARTTAYVDFVFPCTVVMRTQPTLDAVSGTDYYYVYSSNGGYDKFTVPVINSNYNEGSMLVTGYYSGGSYTAGDSLFASTDNASAYLALDAEF